LHRSESCRLRSHQICAKVDELFYFWTICLIGESGNLMLIYQATSWVMEFVTIRHLRVKHHNSSFCSTFYCCFM